MSNSRISTTDRAISTLVKVAALISFVADFIAIFIFISEITKQDANSLPSERALSIGVIALLAFFFSIALVKFAGSDFSGIFIIFGIVYAVLSQIILYLTASSKTPEQAFSISNFMENGWGEMAFYIVSALVVSLFARVVIGKSQIGKKLAAIPYIICSILLIANLIVFVANNGKIPPLALVILIIELLFITLFWSDVF